NDDHLVAKRLEWRENGRELEFGADSLWQPLVVNNSVWMIDNAESLNWFRSSVLGGGQCRHHCVQKRQRDRGSDPTKHCPPGNSFLTDDHYLMAALYRACIRAAHQLMAALYRACIRAAHAHDPALLI